MATTEDGVSTPRTSESLATTPRAKPRGFAPKRKAPASRAGKRTPAKRAKKSDSGLYDTFPEDDHLFADDSDEDGGCVNGREGTPEKLTGQELYLKHKAERVIDRTVLPGPYYFSMKFTIPLTYLALLYTEQNILLADLVRLVVPG